MKRIHIINNSVEGQNALKTLLLAVIILLSSCKQKPEIEEQRITEVSVTNVEEVMFRKPISCSGRLAGKSEIKLSFKTGGVIRSIYADKGQYFSKGQVLAQLDLREIQAHVEQARLGVEKAERDFNRAKNLYKDSVVTLEMYQNATTALDYAKANLEVANFNLQFASITAPANGRVLRRFAEANELIGAGYPVFLFAGTEKNWVLKVDLTDKDIVNVSIGDSAIVIPDAFPDSVFYARVTETGTIADPYTGTYEVELMLENNSTKLISGFFAKAEIIPNKAERYLKIPMDAVSEADGHYANVFVVKKNNEWEKRRIRISHILNTEILVKSGVEKGEKVIVSGGSYLRQDMKIAIRESK